MPVLHLHSEALQEDWLDAYGHLNEAYYLVPFSNATWALQAELGIGTAYFEATGCALYTLETHLRYVEEVRAPAQLDVESMVLGVDDKRLHVGHRLLVGARERATFECMLLHYNTRAGGVATFSAAQRAALKAALVDTKPAWAGRALRSLD